MTEIAKCSPTRPTRERSTPAAAWVAVVAILAYQALSWAVAALNPGWNPLTRQISDYALGRLGWVMIAAFVTSGIAYVALAVALRPQLPAGAARIGLAILLYCGVGSVGVGVFVTDPDTTPIQDISASGLLHVVFGLSALLLLPVAALLVTAPHARHYPLGSPARRILRLVALLPLAGLVGVWVPEVVAVIPAGGWPDRVLFLTYTIWVLVVAAALRGVDRLSTTTDICCSRSAVASSAP